VLKKYPFVKQEGFKDCGCASLLMIIRYYKGNVSIERLRDLTHTNKNGTNAYNLISASIMDIQAYTPICSLDMRTALYGKVIIEKKTETTDKWKIHTAVGKRSAGMTIL